MNIFLQQTLIDVQQQINDLRQSILQTSNLHPPEFSEISWPIGDKKRAKPLSRYDLIRYDLINMTHTFMRDDFQSVIELNPSEKQDVKVIPVLLKLRLSTILLVLILQHIFDRFLFELPSTFKIL